MPTPITKYRCDMGFCRKVYASIYACRKHEKECFHNPLNKSCISCAYRFTDNENKSICNKTKKPIFVKGTIVDNCIMWVDDNFYESDEMEVMQTLN